MSKKMAQSFIGTNQPAHGNLRETPGREPLCCPLHPGSPLCTLASHGFICSFPDGSCLRYQNKEGTAHD